jgi:hypothetical protein
MKHVSILVPEGDSSLTNIAGTYQILNEVNTVLSRAGKAPLFKVQLVGLHKETSIGKGLFSVHPQVLINDVSNTDLIIIPAIHETY